MKRLQTVLALALTLLLVYPIALTALAQEEPIVLNLWVDALVPDSDILLDEADWYITKAVQRFNEKYPNVRVDVTKFSTGEPMPMFKAAALAGTAPDLCNMWTGNYMLDLHDVVLVLNDLIPPEDREAIGNWDAVSVGFNAKNDICGYPLPFQFQTCIYYNKDIVAEAGLDFEANPPRTGEEFLDACEAIRAAGYTPMVEDFSGDPWSVYFVQLYWWLQQSGNDLLVRENTGEVKYVDDQGLLSSLDMFRLMYLKGYLNEDVVAAPDAPNRFLVGQAAMYANGSWALGEYAEILGDKLGMIKPPDLASDAPITGGVIGGAGEGMIVWKDTKHPKEAFELMRFLCSKEEYIEFFKTGVADIPNRNDVTIADVGLSNPLYEKFFLWAEDVQFFPDNIVSPDAMEILLRFIADVTLGKMTPSELAQEMDSVIANR